MKTIFKFHKAFLLTVIFFSIVTITQGQDIIEYAFIKDISASAVSDINSFKPDEIIHKRIANKDLINNGIGMNIYTTCIGLDAFPKVLKSELPKNNYWITSKKTRQSHLDKFRKNTQSILDSVAILMQTNKYSSLYRGVIHTLKQMRPNSTKEVFIYSDGIECSTIANFYDVKDWDKEYERIRQALLVDMPVPTTSNLKIVFITNGRDELTVKAIRFWTRFFLELQYPIQVSVRASI